MTETDRLIITKGPDHQKPLKTISAGLRQAALNESRVFNPANQAEIDRFESEKARDFPGILSEAYQLYLDSEASKAPGHEASHILNALNSAQRIFDEYGKNGQPFKEVEKLEISLAILSHDLGRFTEPSFGTGREDLEVNDPSDFLKERDLEILVPFMIGRKVAPQLGIPVTLADRILYDIASGFTPKTEHLIADVVHQCDREQLSGTIMIPRLIAEGIGRYGMDFIVPPLEKMRSYSNSLPNIYRQPVSELLTRLEFWMRNVYPPVSPEGESTNQQHQLETAVILMLGLHEMEEEEKIVFAPEMGLAHPSELNSTKKPLSAELFDRAKTEYQQFLASVDLNSYSDQEALALVHNLMQTEGVVASDNFDQTFQDKTSSSSSTLNHNRWLIMLYTSEKRHQKRMQDLGNLDQHTIGVAETVKAIVKDDLEDKERIFNHTSPN